MRARDLVRAGASLCIGSDSQAIIDPWEELRSLEYHARLASLRRVILTDPGPADRLEPAPLLLRAGTMGGARALRTGTGRLAVGEPADFLCVDLEHPALAGWNKATLGALLALCAPASVVRDVWVGGLPRVRDGHHDALAPARLAFEQVCQRVLT
jgi:formimidoylglutamate deiminase